VLENERLTQSAAQEACQVVQKMFVIKSQTLVWKNVNKKSFTEPKKIPCVFAVLWYSINMIKTNNTEYVNTLNAFRAGEITEQEWREFCFEVLKEALEVNKDVLIRLKNC
jgi:hypothetical protein